MKMIASLLLLALLTAGCQSGTSYNNHYRGSTPHVEDDVFVYVPESDRGDIATARAESSRMMDSVAVAKRDLDQEVQRLSLAEDQLETTGDEVDTARESLALARDSNEARREKEVENATRQLESARSRWRYGESAVAYNELRVDQLESGVALAKLRVTLADARIEFAKAHAVSKLDRPEAQDVSLPDFQACIDEHEARIAMAEVDADAWKKKLELRQKALDSRREASAKAEADAS